MQVTPRIENVPIIHTAFEIGDPEAIIERYAKEKAFDFIFIGTRDKHGAMDKILGSVAINVMKDAPCPVFVIPEFAAYRTTTIVTYATNLEEVDPYEIWRVSKLLAPFNPIIRCVHFEKETGAEKTAIDMETLKSFFSDNAPALQITFHEIATDNKVDSMLEVLVTFDTNLLVTYQPQRNFWQRLLHRSFTKQMALSAKVPILVLKG
ncbi:MAG: universal stress protein [Saprospiraceae bacterium]